MSKNPTTNASMIPGGGKPKRSTEKPVSGYNEGGLAVSEMTNLRELLAKATPGEWTFRPSEWDDDQVVSGVGGTFFTLDCGDVMGMNDDNAALICAMKNALPGLLDKLERYEAKEEARLDAMYDDRYGED